MRSDPIGILEATITAFALGDIDSTLAYFTPDAELAVFIPQDSEPFGGLYTGREAIGKRLLSFGAMFATVRYVARTIHADGEGFRMQIDYAFQHRISGETLEGVKRVVTSFSEGRIAKWHEYHDAGRIDAFMRLIREMGA